MVEDETLRSENEMFKINLEEKLIPQIRERIDNRENRVDYTENEIKQILGVDYTTENFYQRFKTILLDTDIGISIKRVPGNNKFIFFKKLDSVKRETDLLKVNFEQTFKPKLVEYLNEHPSIGISEEWLKKRLDVVGHSTDNVYNKLRNILIGTEIYVSIERKSDGNGFIFYNKKMVEEHDARVAKEVEEYGEKRKRVLEEERREELKHLESDEFDIEISSRFPLPPSNLSKVPVTKVCSPVTEVYSPVTEVRNISAEFRNTNKHVKFYNEDVENTKDNLDNLSECPICGLNVVIFSPKCNKCGNDLDWKEEKS